MKRLGMMLAVFGLLLGCATAPRYHSVRPLGGAMEFELVESEADSVVLCVSEDGFRQRKAHRHGDRWHVEVEDSGKSIKYFYRVDGEIVVPDCKLRESDGFGGTICIVADSQ